MRSLQLLALNIVRQQRLIIYLMLSWIIGFAILFTAVARPAEGPRDLEMFFRQELAYGILIALFNGSSAIFNERRSRRILAVLSKGISRPQYLASIALFNALMTLVYYLAVGASNAWLIYIVRFEGEVWTAVLAAYIAAQLAGLLGLLFATVLHPWLAAASAGLIIGLPLALDPMMHLRSLSLMPVSLVLRESFAMTYAAGWKAGWVFVGVTAIEMAMAFAIASWLFRRGDVTVPAE